MDSTAKMLWSHVEVFRIHVRPMDSTLKVLQKTCGSTVEPMCSKWESKLNYCVPVHD